MFLSALFVGRLWCGWACPAAGLGEACFAINIRSAQAEQIAPFLRKMTVAIGNSMEGEKGMAPENTGPERNISAARVVASTLGVLVGVAGIDHGIFEVLQGNVVSSSLMIEAIGPAQRFWEHGVETAFTVVPSFWVTGVLAIVLGLWVAVWAAAFVHRRHGAGVLMLLCILLFLVGGGFAPIFMSILASLTASQINRPFKLRRPLLPASVRGFLAKIWLGVLVAFVLSFVVSVEIAIFGWPLTLFLDADATLSILSTLANIMLGLMILSILTGLVHDRHRQIDE